MHFVEWKCMNLNFKKSLNFVPKDRIGSMVQVMDWHGTGDKPLSEQKLDELTHAYMFHSALS